MAREELGIDPEKLGGSPAVAGVACVAPFTVRAAIPVARACGVWPSATARRVWV